MKRLIIVGLLGLLLFGCAQAQQPTEAEPTKIERSLYQAGSWRSQQRVVFKGYQEKYTLLWEDPNSELHYVTTPEDLEYVNSVYQRFKTDQHLGEEFFISFTVLGDTGTEVYAKLFSISTGLNWDSPSWSGYTQMILEKILELDYALDFYQWKNQQLRFQAKQFVEAATENLHNGLLDSAMENWDDIYALIVDDALEGIKLEPQENVARVRRLGYGQLQLDLVDQGNELAVAIKTLPPALKESITTVEVVAVPEDIELGVTWKVEHYLAIQFYRKWFLLLPE